MEEAKWWKFSPYKDSPHCVWYAKFKDSPVSRGGTADSYISYSKNERREYYKLGGSFSNYTLPYMEVDLRELNWIKECETQNKYIPIEEVKFEEVINNYSIY